MLFFLHPHSSAALDTTKKNIKHSLLLDNTRTACCFGCPCCDSFPLAVFCVYCLLCERVYVLLLRVIYIYIQTLHSTNRVIYISKAIYVCSSTSVPDLLFIFSPSFSICIYIYKFSRKNKKKQQTHHISSSSLYYCPKTFIIYAR